MSKTWSTALVFSLLLVLMLVFTPVSGKSVGTVVCQGATVFIGEGNLDMSPIFSDSVINYNLTGHVTEGSAGAHPVPLNGSVTGDGIQEYLNAVTLGVYTNDVADITGTVSGDYVGTITGTHTYNATNPVVDIVKAKIVGNKNGDSFVGYINGSFYNPGTSGNFKGNLTVYTTHRTTIGWWASGASIVGTAPKTIELGNRYSSMTITQSEFVGYTGNWYRITYGEPVLAFYVADPQIDIDIWNPTTSQSLNGKTVVQGTNLTFRINTNMYAINDGKRSDLTPGTSLNKSTDGFINLKVKSQSGATYNSLVVDNGSSVSTTGMFIDTQPYTWNNVWATGSVNGGNQYNYPPGTYNVYAESDLNGMKDNYRNSGADYTGKTISATNTITLVSDTIKLISNMDTVIRGKAFSVTVTGKTSADYHLWIKGIGSMNGTDTNVSDSMPPKITLNQEGVFVGQGGDFKYENGGGKNISQSVPVVSGDNPFYALVHTSASGTRTIEFGTSSATKAQKYTIRVESDHTGSAAAQSDEVDVNVEKGAVTIVAAGDQSYFLGEEIKLSGTNSESYTTYLFIVGPNLPSAGALLSDVNPRNAPVSTHGYTAVPVNGDNSWSYKWGTATVALDAGTYTIYAVNIQKDADSLSEATYGTTSIVLKKPFVAASVSSSTVAQGDALKIVGTAEGDPSQGVAIWIMGKNFNVRHTQSINADASFRYDIYGSDTKTLATGQYFVVVQHPMQNDQFDIILDPSNNDKVMNRILGGGMDVFTLNGAGSLQGSDAANALIEAIGDPNVDDTYTKFQFLVETPYIYIAPVGDKHIADKFTIKSDTNLAIDDQVLVEVYSSSFKPTQKSQSGEFSGATGTVKVTKGDANNGLNAIKFDVDTTAFRSDEYIVKESAIVQDATGTALFNVLDGLSAPTVVPTPVATPIVVTVVPTQTTAVPTIEQTTVQTPTKTTTQSSPGFAALFALAGLAVVGFIVVRRE